MSLFSKQHYVWLSSVFRDELYETRYSQNEEVLVKKIISSFADQLEIENPNFSKPRFLHNIYCAHDHNKNEKCPYSYIKNNINLETIAEFTWGFGSEFLLKVENEYYIWSDPDYSGDNTLKPYLGNPKNFTQTGFCGRDKGIHKIIDYCGPDVKIIS